MTFGLNIRYQIFSSENENRWDIRYAESFSLKDLLEMLVDAVSFETLINLFRIFWENYIKICKSGVRPSKNG